MDEADRADTETQSAITEGRWQVARAPALQPHGACHFCEEPVVAPRLFCDKACCEDFELEESQLRRSGKR